MERPRASTVAWIALLGGVAAYEYFCKNGETLSERVWDVEHPVKKLAVASAIGVTALHLLGKMPAKIDPFVHMGKLKRSRDG